MTGTEYILCKQRKRLWPAKVLSRSSTSRTRQSAKDKSAFVCVEILCLNKQIKLHCADTEPLTKSRIEEIASKLGPSKKCRNQLGEITYRRALREALDILPQGTPSKGKSPLKGRRGTPSTQKETQELSSQGDPCERESQANAEGAHTPLQAAQIEDECHLRSRVCTRSSSKHEASPSSQQDLFNSEGPTGQHSKTSKAKVPVRPVKEQQPLPEPCTDRKSPQSLKEAWTPRRLQGKSDGGSCSPSPAPQHLPRTSTPARASRRRCTRLTPEGPKSGAGPRWRCNLLCSPEFPSEPASDLSEEGESPPRKHGRGPDGKTGPEGSGSCRQRRGRSRPENLHPAPSPDAWPLEHKGVAEQRMCEEEEELAQCFEDKEGLDSACVLSPRLSPVQEISSSQALRDNEEEEEEELPSFLLNEQPCSIKPGMLVWCRLPRNPYWPAVVKRVNRKSKKASVVLVEKDVDDKSKGFSAYLNKLKHFDCEEKQKLIDKAAESYSCEINWCIKLIADYRIRVGCHSFTGSLLEYCADDMSCPVRKEASEPPSLLAFPKAPEAAPEELLLEAAPTRLPRKVLPDRMRAARDRANKRLVDFIVKARGADAHLRSILWNTKPSQWLQKFLRGRPFLTFIETYLEDDHQQDLVVDYLQEVYQEAGTKVLPLVNGNRLNFILEVLFPEAIIYAISAVDQIDYKTAEEKYIQGPLVTQREKQIFEETIREEKRKRCRQSKRLSLEDKR